MNASLRWSAVLAIGLTHAVFAQTVDFNNNRNFATTADRLVRFADGTPLVGTNYHVQLYYGADVTSLQSVSNAPARFRAVTTGGPGTWAGGIRTLTGFSPGDTVTMLVRAWDSLRGPTFEAAQAAGGPVGESAPFLYEIPQPGSAITAFYIENFRGFTIFQCLIELSEPTNGTVLRGPAAVTFRADLTGAGHVTNVVYMAGTNVVGSSVTPPFSVTTAILPVDDYLFQAIAELDTGEYCASSLVLVRVMQPPNPVVQPASFTALSSSTATFTASPGGSEPNSYQWYDDNGVIPNATSSSLVLSNVTSLMDGLYTCFVSNAVGMATSAPVRLRVRPVIVYADGQPVHTTGYTSTAPVTVSLETSYERGPLFYTLDGSEPNFGATQYGGPLRSVKQVCSGQGLIAPTFWSSARRNRCKL
jgi:hypothetical protein